MARVGKGEDVKSRALTEEHARDSFENLLFSVCRFRELTGKYPQNITVSSVYFKNSCISFSVYPASVPLYIVFDIKWKYDEDLRQNLSR